MQADAIRVDGCTITPETLDNWRRGRSGIQAEVGAFLASWWSNTPTLSLQTSGSTGRPKVLQASRAAMAASAAATCRAFQLQADHTALLCLPMRYIAGQMMVVRALVGGLHLITTEPTSTPLAGMRNPVDFAPMVPMQVVSTLAQPGGRRALERIGVLLLGGGFIDSGLEESLQGLRTQVYASYGMTETLSHIALRAVNGPRRSALYTPLPGIRLSLAPGGTLQVEASYLETGLLTTNDLAEITPDGSFRILGRADAVINSGGVKIQAEALEQELQQRTGLQVLALPIPHPVLGQCVALLWEGPAEAENTLRTACAELPRYHQPKQLHRCTLPRTGSGKPARAEASSLLARLTPA